MTEIQGIVEEIIFENQENGYKVCAFDCDDDYITVKGLLPSVSPGEYLILQGEWETHREYGEQFAVSSFEKKLPERTEDIESFLSSGLIDGVGPATAHLIVQHFGEDTFHVILEEPYKLESLKGISHQKAIRIHETMAEHQNMSGLVIFLGKYQIGAAMAAKVFQCYGAESIDRICKDPYCLFRDIPGIGFRKADEIAVSLSLPANLRSRICAGIISVLSDGCQGGHAFAPQDVLLSVCRRMLGCSDEDILAALEELRSQSQLKIVTGSFGIHVYLWSMYNKELYIARKLKELAEVRFRIDDRHFEDVLSQFENSYHIRPDDKQRRAVKSAGENGFSIITGGPGTGKTTIIRCVLHYLSSIGVKCLLAAPTGRAAKRMTEACEEPAKTIHRLLEINANPDGEAEELSFKRNELNPLECDAVILDESSMVDMVLFYHLLRAVRPGIRLIMVGDVDQLPSVGPGAILSDCINSELFNTVILDEIYRQETESLIPANAFRINHGDLPKVNTADKDFFFIRCSKQEEILETVLELCEKRLPGKYHVNAFSDIQVIIPTKKGTCGVLNTNRELQRVLNPKEPYKSELEAHGMVFREGDRVMQIKNDYDMEWTRGLAGEETGTGVFNGEMGLLTHIDKKSRTVHVLFDDDREAIYDGLQLSHLELCYAVTVHKSQGSEFDYCVLPIFPAAPKLMTRNLLYTAVTRARKMVILVGSEESLIQMIRNDTEQLRYTGLKELLCQT